MFLRYRNTAAQKGQGVIEYTLLLGLILGIALIMHNSDFTSTVTGTFERVAYVLGIPTEKAKWATMSTEALLADKDSSAERLKADQDFLRNIGKHFIGMTQEEVEKTFDSDHTSNVLIGTFKEGKDINNNFYSDFYTKRVDGNPTTDNLYNWGQGMTGTTPYDSSRRYLYSDYAVKSASTVKTGSGIKAMDIKYENGRVSSISIAINPNTGGGKEQDLYVTVTK